MLLSTNITTFMVLVLELSTKLRVSQCPEKAPTRAKTLRHYATQATQHWIGHDSSSSGGRLVAGVRAVCGRGQQVIRGTGV